MSIRMMIVDDSPFSRTMLSEVLVENGYEVVGEADSLEGLIEIYDQCKPDLVTMDIAMPGADGFECSRALRRHDPKAKIILASSMKDEETEMEARRIGVAGYVQKPVDIEALERVITKIMSPDDLFEHLMERGLDVFKEALSQNVTRMAKTPVTYKEMDQESPYMSHGITAVIGIIGYASGSMILDVSDESAEKIAEAILRRPAKDREEVVNMVAELANIVAGIACSMINKKDKAFGLRVSPPSLFHGNTAEIISPKMSLQTCLAETDLGGIFLAVGFKKGSVLWM